MMSAKITALGFLKIKVFWNKGYNVIIFVHDVTKRILWRDSNYIVDVVTWPKFDNSNISMRSYYNLNFTRIWLILNRVKQSCILIDLEAFEQ